MAYNRKGFTITWRIENYNFFIKGIGHGIESPPFVIDSTKYTSWVMDAVATSKIKNGHMVFRVSRRKHDPAEDLELDFEISVFKEDYSFPVFEETFTRPFCSNQEYFLCFIPHHQVYSKKINEFILPKVLTVRWRIFKRKGSFLEAVHCFMRTRIRVETSAFVAFTETFSSLIPKGKKILTIKSTSEKAPILNLNLSLGGNLCCKDKLWIEILPSEKNYIKFCVCELFLVDSEGGKTKCGNNKFLFHGEAPQEWKFPLYFTKGYLIGRNTQFLSNDTLTLKCEFAFSTGIEYNEIEDSEFGNLAVHKNLSRSSSVMEDMKCLFKEGTLSDLKLQTKTETFNVHRKVLSTRSSVFKTMFTTDMKEKTTDCVSMEDLDADTVRRMLTFLYSDSLENLDWKSATNLYYAADKYNITALKHRCSSFLKNYLQPSCCCELLLMSDRHQDEDLKNAAQEYITLNRDAVIHTSQWSKLEESNPVLVIETFRAMC